MAYEKQTWQNNSKATPLSAARMSHLEDGIAEIDTAFTDLKLKTETVEADLLLKQNILLSGETIKTINGQSLLGSGDIEIETSTEEDTTPFTVNGVICKDAEIKLPVGKTYELAGCLEGHIIIDAVDAGLETEQSANTQLILNNVVIKADVEQAIYSNQTKKKLVITSLANTINKFSTGVKETELISTAVIEVKNSLYFETGKDSIIEINSACGNHAVKAQSLYLDGAGKIVVDSIHDGFHGSRIIRVSSGVYQINNAKDAFGTSENGLIQVIGGEINIVNCTEDGFDSKLSGGVIAGYDTKITFNTVAGKLFNNISVLETVPTITGYDDPRTTLKEYFGTGSVKTGNADTGTAVELIDGKYTTDATSVYVTGYIENPIVLTSQSTDIYFNKACIIASDDTGVINYTSAKKKLALRSDDDVETVNYIINTGTGPAIRSKNLTIQKDSSYIIKSNSYNIDAYEVVLRGDGTKAFSSEIENINCTALYLGADSKDIDSGGEFSTGAIICNKDILCEVTKDTSDLGIAYITYGQIGSIICNNIRANQLNKFYTGNSVLHIQTKKSINLILLKDHLINDIRTRVRTLETALESLLARVTTLEQTSNDTTTSK